jgi:PhnB protein
VTDQFYSDRAGALQDPFSHTWHIHTHTEDVSPAELKRTWRAMQAKWRGR